MGASGPGRTRLVLFWSPDCPPCQRMLPELAVAARTWSGIRRGDHCQRQRRENLDLANAGLSIPIALQSRQEASRAFQVLESPAAVRISPEGTIVGTPASGVQAIWSLMLTSKQALDKRWGYATGLTDPPLVSMILTTRDRPDFLPIALRCFAEQDRSLPRVDRR